jgi:hypothetical protein
MGKLTGGSERVRPEGAHRGAVMDVGSHAGRPIGRLPSVLPALSYGDLAPEVLLPATVPTTCSCCGTQF